MSRILTIAASLLCISMLAGSSSAATAPLAGDFQITRRNGTDYVSLVAPDPGNPARNKTELALKCWLGLVGYKGCWKSDGCNGADGPVKKVEYLGGTAAGVDVYKVGYMSAIAVYLIAPDPMGNADQYLVKATDHYWIKKEISPPAAPILIYNRPENAPLVNCWRWNADP